ncbi:MAG: UDP-N-acetylenolpyruvoylglucosamine reductase [Hydrogenothermus sp.]|nr:MAG: UDP-N-acetylenolpyruvoylglucosamine reductase [Hydrogenothermus sp.]
MKILENLRLSNFSTIKIGGVAKKVYFPENLEDVVYLIKLSQDTNKKLIPVGIGSNLIFKDGFLDYIFVSTKYLKDLNLKQSGEYFYINAQAGVSFKTLINIVKKYNLEGFENLSGIPASIGGAVAMNAGAFGSEIFDIVEEVYWINNKAELIVSKKENIRYSYRYSQFQEEGFVYKVVLRLKKSNKDISKIIRNHLIERNKKQPLNLPTTGSTYKNPEGSFAGYLLEKSGFKGKRIGDIGFSEKHANFLVNYGDAKFKDLKKLLELAEEKVKKEFNINLKREVRIIE